MSKQTRHRLSTAGAIVALAGVGLAATRTLGQEAASSSLLTRAQESAPEPTATEPHALRSVSLFAVAPAEARIFHEHDLIQIIVRESIRGRSTQELETEKDLDLSAVVQSFPDFVTLLKTGILTNSTEHAPAVDVGFSKEFEGEGDYERRDDFTARLTAEVIEILPNANLVLESRSRWTQDAEEFVLKVTGICRPQDVTPANTILSVQLHDLRIEKINTGELKEANRKGLLTKVLEGIFAF